MPTELPTKRSTGRPPCQEPPLYRDGDTSVRDLIVAAALLVSVLGLLCEQSFGPTPGYSLVETHGELQLSP